MSMWNVKFIKDRQLKAANGRYFTADAGYVVYACVQGGRTAEEAVESARLYAGQIDYDRVVVSALSEFRTEFSS